MAEDKGNGADLGAIYQAIRAVDSKVAGIDSKVAALDSKVAGLAEDLAAHRQETRAGFADVRQTITEYHSAVIGHGILISDLEARLRRVERQLGIDPETSRS
jgi:outer membrane murein-binding lipoprotein Lpp